MRSGVESEFETLHSACSYPSGLAQPGCLGDGLFPCSGLDTGHDSPSQPLSLGLELAPPQALSGILFLELSTWPAQVLYSHSFSISELVLMLFLSPRNLTSSSSSWETSLPLLPPLLPEKPDFLLFLLRNLTSSSSSSSF